MKYQVNRIGFVNFWLYDEEDFYFYDGKLLLRGTNGSGKTVTMQSFFPLIFDGNKSPERLDPFGSRDRKIEDYLLPEDFQGNENTGYLYMEFYNKEENKYLTIGMGLRAIRNRNCEFWGFAITDNRRIGQDFLLFKESNLRIPLTKKELQARISSGGEFVETTKDYKAMVNRLLFGFPTIDLYSEFINLLIQVRSPKLSNSTKPSQLTKILSTVLEPLSEEDLRTMADSIEGMNKYKEKLSDLEIEQKACNSLKNSFLDYNKAVLYQKGENYLKYKKEQTDIIKELKEKEEKLKELNEEIGRETLNLKDLNLELEDLEHKKSNLDQTDLKSITKELDDVINMLKKLESDKTKESYELDKKESDLFKNQKELKDKEDTLFEIEKSFSELLTYLKDIQLSCFKDNNYYLEKLQEEKFEFREMPTFISSLKNQISLLTYLKDLSYQKLLKEKEIENLKNKYAEDEDKLKDLKEKHVEISNHLIEESDNLKNVIAKTSLENKVLKLEQDELDNLYLIIDNLERDMFVKIKEFLMNVVYNFKDKIKSRISSNKIKISEYEEKIKNLKLELLEIDNKLLKHLDDMDTINYFKEENIDYAYFYELIEFKEDTNKEKRKQIESFLFESGILTSFITLKDDLESLVKTRCLKPSCKVKNNLLKYLKPTDTKYKDKVEKILESISLESDSNIKILDNGKYEFALIVGNTNLNHELRYIGESTRLEYISHEKEKIEININKYLEEIKNLEQLNINLNDDIETLDIEYNSFNYQGNILNLFKELDKINFDIDNLNNSLNDQIIIIQNLNHELKDLEVKLESSKQDYLGSLDYQDILEVIDNLNKSKELVGEILNIISFYKNTYELVNYYKLNISNLYSDLDNIKLKLQDIDYSLETYKNKQQNLDDIINSDKYKDIGLEYKKISERLLVLKDEIPNKRDLITRNKTNVEYLENNILELKNNLELKDIYKELTYKIFKDEYNLHYVLSDDLKENEITNFLKEIKSNNTMRESYEKFNDALNKHAQVLINYAPKNITLHDDDSDYKDYLNREIVEIKELISDAKRRDLVFNYLGKNVNLLDLSKAIDNSISSYENLISEENRRLFEDLLINNIGSSIRNKIYQSEEWIKVVKDYMESMNTSSGLSFSLKWDGITALNEDELDTREIVNIFKKDASNLKPEHLTKITNHFKSKIKGKEEVLEENERNYLEIMKDVLDYRKWFEFKLYFKRGNNPPKELTDREFNKMSGGEKAIAMYIPLFSSIYAKLNSAYKTAPHVIALDEAFAGVDDENIKDAFRILSKLDLDYVLTSQQLWGDYDTVKHLAISELHHPIGSKVVSILKYKWDGIKRSKVDDPRDYED